MEQESIANVTLQSTILDVNESESFLLEIPKHTGIYVADVMCVYQQPTGFSPDFD